MRHSSLESKIQAEVLDAIGAEPDVLILRNQVGAVKYFDEKTGEPRFVTMGLGTGSPDLVGILRIAHGAGFVGIWFALEIKAEKGRFEKDQLKVHEIWRRFGALVFVVRSADEARQALIVARGMVAS